MIITIYINLTIEIDSNISKDFNLVLYANSGRPGGPAFYISTVDNSQNHGPGSQGSKSEVKSYNSS